MSSVLQHRGPDGHGVWQSNDHSVGLAHRRLAIIDLSAEASQPMSYQNDRLWITYNGEIYNYKELREELTGKGARFRTQSDTEVVLAAFAEYGVDCVKKFDGMFAFAIWDSRNSSLFCARDRFGEKPFFYHLSADGYFYFASEMKSFFAAGIDRNPDRSQIYDYLAHNFYEASHDRSRTFYQDIKQLDSAHYLLVDQHGNRQERRYWHIDLTKKRDLKIEEAEEEFYRLFKSSVSRRLRSDVEVGTSLSGGLDSSSIVLLIKEILHDRNATNRLQTFSARFDDPTKDEGKFIQYVLDTGQLTENFTWPTGQTLIDELDRAMYFQEEPFGSSSFVAQWAVMKLAKETGVTVLVDGQGADELLAGYPRYFHTLFTEMYRAGRPELSQEIQNYEQNQGIKFSLDMRFKLQAKFIEPIARARSLKQSLWGVKGADDIHPDLRAEFRRQPTPFRVFPTVDEALKTDMCERGLKVLLRSADRNSMAHSREVRLPFLNHELVEFVFSLPNSMKLHNGWTKYILRKSMQAILPQEIAWRKDKVGFAPPQEKWMKHPQVQEKIAHSIKVLTDEHLIAKPDSRKSWQYLMAAYLFKA